ncbi:MAG: ABC transporter ATP-binding protein [Kiritimatiellia bacterium]|jgi:ABC-type polysaccharide/polyol phosphate transport system ATPase subunit
MNDETAIDVSHIVKRFRLTSSAGSLKTAVLDGLRRRSAKRFTALDDVSFTVKRGETLGLIGANGAGKSTLLSIIAGTIHPTSGHVRTRGVVSSLLELGAGFHPDLTGRENVLLYGAIMGIPRETMRKRFDAIVDFSGLAAFIDQPVRFYSSGMYVRLGFAVAVQVDPDILLVDEVLAVGDADFQRRCLDKMAEFRRAGKAMLIISHDMNTIRSVSDRIAYLERGRLKGIGAPHEMTARYGADTVAANQVAATREWGTGEARITSAKMTDATGAPCDVPPDDQMLHFRLTWHAPKRIETPTFGFSIANDEGTTIFGSNTEIAGFDLPFIEGEGSLTLAIDAGALHAGGYTMSFSLHSRDHAVNYHRLENTLPFHLPGRAHFDGICHLPSTWS